MTDIGKRLERAEAARVKALMTALEEASDDDRGYTYEQRLFRIRRAIRAALTQGSTP
jgi:hypothetical protein